MRKFASLSGTIAIRIELFSDEAFMFSSTIIDVAIGVIFSFATVSLVSSAVLEAISSILKWRASNLFKGVKTLVNDPSFAGLALELYRHAAINPLGVRTAATPANTVDLKRKPAYIASQQFAAAMTDVLTLSALVTPAGPPNIAAMKGAVTAALTPANPQIKDMVHGMIDRSNGDLKQIEAALAAWFDNGMDRLSGAYKRQTQLVTFVISLLLAASLNVDTVRIARVLWSEPTLVDDLKLPADVPGKLCPPAGPAQNVPAPVNTAETSTASPPNPGTAAHCDLSSDAETTLSVLEAHLPVGWSQKPTLSLDALHDPKTWLPLVGWLITAFATLFGAPFWFDALQSFVRLKGTGPSPKETRANRAAAA